MTLPPLFSQLIFFERHSRRHLFLLHSLPHSAKSKSTRRKLSFQQTLRKDPFLNGNGQSTATNGISALSVQSESNCPHLLKMQFMQSISRLAPDSRCRARDHLATCKWGSFSVTRQAALNEPHDFPSLPTWFWQSIQTSNGRGWWKPITALLSPAAYQSITYWVFILFNPVFFSLEVN